MRPNHVPVGSGRRRAQLQRPLHRVRARLHPGHLPGMGQVATAGRGPGQVAALPLDELDHQPPPDPSHRLGQLGDQVVGLGVGQVADQDGDALAEARRAAARRAVQVQLGGQGVHRRLAAPGGRLVHHVVVDQGEDVQQLQGGAGLDHVVVRRPARWPPAATQPQKHMLGRIRLPPVVVSTRSISGRSRSAQDVHRRELQVVGVGVLGQVVPPGLRPGRCTTWASRSSTRRRKSSFCPPIRAAEAGRTRGITLAGPDRRSASCGTGLRAVHASSPDVE